MSNGPVRRAQLIAPFGVGAMTIVRNGTSMICAGLDYWFRIPEGEDSRSFDLNEFKIYEWRLQELLKVSHFRLPPDYRINYFRHQRIPNCNIKIPFFRFPRWHYCTSCGKLMEFNMYVRGLQSCPDCKKKGKNRKMVQVPFVALCDQGHIQDFPWREWVHKTSSPQCNKPMKLIATGGATLAGQKVVCECGEERTLAGIMTSAPIEKGGETILTSTLDKSGARFACQGWTPWFGDEKQTCDRPLHGSLRSASNVYFAHVQSSIYLPRGADSLSEVIEQLEQPPISTLIFWLSASGQKISPKTLREQHGSKIVDYSDRQIEQALEIIINGKHDKAPVIESDSEYTRFRRQEYNILRSNQDTDKLSVKHQELTEYNPDIAKYFSHIALVDKLQETRVLTGFSRILPENGLSIEERKALLWKEMPPYNDLWFPAYVVYGEGIFLEFNEQLLAKWLSDEEEHLDTRVKPLNSRYQHIQEERNLKLRTIGPRFILVHTFAHILMNRLVFECGYSSSALRERLFVSDSTEAPMAALLIYTAAGDSEGTLGGLVRMGRPGFLEPIVRRALEAVQWCSSDPVCMEMGELGGQGPDSCNLSACHSCCLVPETACEEFNRFLDRGLVIGNFSNPRLGFFNM